MSGCSALGVSLAVHALLAAGLAAYLARDSGREIPATLDVTHVELCLTERKDETADVASRPIVPAFDSPSPPPEDVPPAGKGERLQPPDPFPARLSEPEEKSPTVMDAVSPHQARVEALPRPKRTIRPDYPREARRRGESGDVALDVDVSADGSVSAVRLFKSAGFPLLDAAAVEAVRNARFTPASAKGRPVASTVRLSFAFRLK